MIEESVRIETEVDVARATTPMSATVAAPALAVAALTACGGGGNGDVFSGSEVRPTLLATNQISDLSWTHPQSDADAARFLNQAQFSSSTSEIAAVRSLGYAAWLEQQFAATPGQSGWDWLHARDYQTTNDTNKRFHESFIDYPADNML